MNASWLVTTIKAILKTPIQKFEKPTFSFRIAHEAAVSNSKILVLFNGYLGAAIEAQKVSPLKHGSELRDTADLSKLLYYHKYNINTINIIQQGSSYHLYPIEEETQKSDLEVIIVRENHKSSYSEINSSSLEYIINKEIDHGW